MTAELKPSIHAGCGPFCGSGSGTNHRPTATQYDASRFMCMGDASAPEVGLTPCRMRSGPCGNTLGARSLADGAASVPEDEPGIRFDAKAHLLQMCWTVKGD